MIELRINKHINNKHIKLFEIITEFTLPYFN